MLLFRVGSPLQICRLHEVHDGRVLLLLKGAWIWPRELGVEECLDLHRHGDRNLLFVDDDDDFGRLPADVSDFRNRYGNLLGFFWAHIVGAWAGNGERKVERRPPETRSGCQSRVRKSQQLGHCNSGQRLCICLFGILFIAHP